MHITHIQYSTTIIILTFIHTHIYTYAGSMVLSSLYYLATAEVMSYNTNVYNIFPSRYKHEVMSILLIIISFILTFIRKRLVYSYIFLCILGIIVLVYISVIIGISYNSYTNTDSFKNYAGMFYISILSHSTLYSMYI